MKPCVIFDLDGTLCDTSRDLLAAANAAFRVLGRNVVLDAARDEDRATALRGGRAMLRLGLSRLGPVDEAEVDAGYQPLLDAYARDICTHTTFFPGARETVQRLRDGGYAVGIATNKPERLARALMTELGALGEYASLIGADTLPVRKPDPAHLWAAVDGAGGDRARCLLVGDSTTDRDTTEAAGVPCLLFGFLAPVAGIVRAGSEELSGYDALEPAVERLIGAA